VKWLSYSQLMSKNGTKSKKHHFVPQAQLRHFACDARRKTIWVFDKSTDRSWPGAIGDTGSENHFNTVELKTGRWNFEDIFQDVDNRSAQLISKIIEQKSVAKITESDRTALSDLIATQILRTHFTRTSPLHIAKEIRGIISSLGYNPDDAPSLAMPNDSSLRLGAVKSFLEREDITRSMARLNPALFAAGTGQQFVLSDHPVTITNAFPYGDVGLDSHGIMVVLPISPKFAVVLVCPTVIERYMAIDQVGLETEQRARMERYRNGFRFRTPIEIQATELSGWNNRQVGQSARFLYSATDGFKFARDILDGDPELRQVKTHVHLGKMGSPPPRRNGMPDGLHLVIQGVDDHCMWQIEEIDKSGEGLTARTKNIGLLGLVAQDARDIRVELYDNGLATKSMSAATIERFGNPSEGWFRVVHRDSSLRALMKKIGIKSSN